MALYRDMPWLFKGFFWFTTDAVNRAALNTDAYENGSGARDGINVPYVIDDAQYYERLRDKHLTIHDDEGANSTLRLIHLYGAHYPYTLDEDAERHGEYDGITEYQQSLGTLHIVDEYLSQMKQLGVYDDATIIITADHGYWFWDDTIEQSESDGDMAGGPIMLVKPSQTAEEAAQPYQTSDARTGFVDFAATIVDAVGGDSAKYGPTMFEANDPNRTRYYYWPTHDGTDDLIIYEYAINGDVTDWDSWSRTGVSWDYYK